MTNAVMSESKIPSRTGQDTSLSGDLERPPVRFFFLAKGFARIFWGLLIAMILFFGNAAVEVFHFVKLPAYVVGCALAAWGLWMLPTAGAVSLKWRPRVRAAMALVFLQIYFAPFLEWWKGSPHVAFYFVNVLGLLLVGMLMLFFVNLLAADAFGRLRDRGGRIEALIFAWGVVLLMIAPLVLTAACCLLAAFRYKTDFEFEMWQAVGQLPIWIYMVLTIPCSLTLIATWKAKDSCYRRLALDDADANYKCSAK